MPATPNRNPHGVFTPRSAARHNGHLEAVVKRRLSTARAEWQQEVEAELDQRDAAHREELEAELAAAKAEADLLNIIDMGKRERKQTKNVKEKRKAHL